MVEITVDGKEYQVDETKNLIDALKDVQIEVPHFCYHSKLSVVGMCRICLIEIEGDPKLQPACNTPVKEGMKLRVASEKAVKAREGVMEFLLINHPLDCPVCDKSGECQLQDYSFTVGSETTRYEEVKRNIPQESIGSNLLINHNRCILCHRCVRFDREIVGVHDLEFADRGNDTVIAYTPPDETSKELDHNYQGALADICPVGALLNKNTLFSSRVWWFDEKQSICHGCSTLCHVTTNTKKNELYRYMPPANPEKNGYFICDQGRFSSSEFSKDRLFHYVFDNKNSTSRFVLPKLRSKIQESKNILWLGGSIDSNEEIQGLLALKKEVNEQDRTLQWEHRTQGYMWQGSWDEAVDFLYMKDQRPNSKMCRDQDITCFRSQQEMEKALKTFDLIFILNEFSSPYSYLSNDPERLRKNALYQLFENENLWNKIVSLSTHENEVSQKALFSLPIQAFPEKNAHFTNKTGEVRKANQSIPPPQGLSDTLGILQRVFDPFLSKSNQSLKTLSEEQTEEPKEQIFSEERAPVTV